MKKIVLGLFAIGLVTGGKAQEAAEKNIQAGISTAFGMNFQKMETKLMDTDGVGTDFTIGAMVNWGFTETIGLSTGVEFDFETLKYKASATEKVYYYYTDTKILQQEEAASNASAELFQMTTRVQKPVYLSIPTMLLFRTNFIGYFRYFGKFGLRNSFLLGNTINDTGYTFEPASVLGTATGATNDNMKGKGDMFFFKSAVGLSGGVEWNFTGSTSLVAELGYFYGFTPLHPDRADEKTTLYTSGMNNGNGNDLHFSNQSKQQQLQLKISILF